MHKFYFDRLGLLEEQKSELNPGGGSPGAETQEKDPAAALAKAKEALEDGTMTFTQRINAGLQLMAGIQIPEQVATIQAQLNTANESIKQKDAEIARITAELETANKQLTAANQNVKDIEAQNATLQTEAKDLRAKEQDLSKRAETLAKEKIKALGFDSGKLPAQDDKLSEKSAEDKIRELTGNDRIKAALHYQKHQALPDWMN